LGAIFESNTEHTTLTLLGHLLKNRRPYFGFGFEICITY